MVPQHLGQSAEVDGERGLGACHEGPVGDRDRVVDRVARPGAVGVTYGATRGRAALGDRIHTGQVLQPVPDVVGAGLLAREDALDVVPVGEGEVPGRGVTAHLPDHLVVVLLERLGVAGVELATEVGVDRHGLPPALHRHGEGDRARGNRRGVTGDPDLADAGAVAVRGASDADVRVRGRGGQRRGGGERRGGRGDGRGEHLRGSSASHGVPLGDLGSTHPSAMS